MKTDEKSHEKEIIRKVKTIIHYHKYNSKRQETNNMRNNDEGMYFNALLKVVRYKKRIM